MSHSNLLSWLNEAMVTHADLVALAVRRGDDVQRTTYTDLDERSSALALGLLDLGLSAGDRVGILAPNSPEWTLVDLACLKAGLVSVPLYTTSTPGQIAHVLGDSGARLVVAGTADLLDRAAQAVRQESMDVQLLLADRGVWGADAASADTAPVGSPHRRISELIDTMDDAGRGRLASLAQAVDPGDPVTIIYTSGTTGRPKGVVVTHEAYCHQLAAIDALFNLPRGARNMSFLPLSHAYERAWTYVVLASGLENCSVENPKTVAEAMLDIRPDTFVSVPRLYEKVYAGAHARAGDGAKRRIFDWAFRVGHEVAHRRREGLPVPAALAARHAVADRVVLRNVRVAVGGPKHVMASGGAPLRREVEEFFLAAGLTVYQGYGLTEGGPLVSCNAPGATRFGTVGRPVPGTQVRIAAETGEICFRGPNVTPGYHGAPEATAEVIDEEGWFHTGDVGHLDGEGYLVITDRIKDLIVTMQGKNIAPGPMESALNADPLIETAVVVGDGRPFLTALIQPSFEELEARATEEGWPVQDRAALLAHPEVQRTYEEIIERQGADLAPYERIQRFRLLEQELTMDAGELTPTLKVRRRPVERRFADLIEDMYS
ncbi:MAG: long-chain fatty acid--CoA ligase [Mobilicoccus sp.]|nr:long-chain fatty acid--CoA ligase [Mobilicoccus sp.]